MNAFVRWKDLKFGCFRVKRSFQGIIIQLTLANIEQDIQSLNLTGLPEWDGKLPDTLLGQNVSGKIPSKENVEKALAEKCKKHGGQNAYENALAAKQKTVDCLKDLVNFEQLQQEMEEAKPKGDLDSVFKKYCKKSPQFKGCISNFTTAFQPCLDEKEKDSVATVLNVTEQLAEFICYKEGDRIALFIAEGGPECLNASKDAIRSCVETVFKKNFPNSEDITVNDIPLLLFKAEQCADFFALQTCVVHQLEKCKEPTPANIVDSLFNFIKKVTPCSSYKFVEETSSVVTKSSASSSYSLVTLIMTILFSFFFSSQLSVTAELFSV